MKGTHKVFLVLATLLFVQFPAWTGSTYSDLAVKLAQDTYVLLVEHHVCEDTNECRVQERVFAGGSPDRAGVVVFKAGDLSLETQYRTS